MTDHDLLTRVDERVEQICRWCTNHDAHHFRYNVMAWTSCVGLIITLITLIIKLV